jgi:spoIIIJ-associated protein
MKKIEAESLEEAYCIACETFDCSMNELKYEVVQYPSNGFLGLYSKPAIIDAAAEKAPVEKPAPVEKVQPVVVEKSPEPRTESEPSRKAEEAKSVPIETPEVEKKESPKEEERAESSHEEIIDRFFDEDEGGSEEGSTAPSLQLEIEEQLKALMESSCFDIDVVEVDVIDDTAYIFLDGEDAALIIGKEGYRYNALSYLLFNWIHGKYKLFIKLEIAQFLSSQEEMIRHYIQPVIEHVEREGWGRTRPLDGILVQIALEQLREAFPNKYVAIKRQRDGGRYVLINEFNNRRR